MEQENKVIKILLRKKYFNTNFSYLTYSFKFAGIPTIMMQLLLRQRQVMFFIIAGALSAVVEIGSFKIFSTYLPEWLPGERNFFGIRYPLSNVCSTGCGIIFNYFLSIWFVFERGKHSARREFAYFMGVSVFSTILSLLLFQVFYTYVFRSNFNLGFYTLSALMISKIAAIALVSVINYSLKKRVIFNG